MHFLRWLQGKLVSQPLFKTLIFHQNSTTCVFSIVLNILTIFILFFRETTSHWTLWDLSNIVLIKIIMIMKIILKMNAHFHQLQYSQWILKSFARFSFYGLLKMLIVSFSTNSYTAKAIFTFFLLGFAMSIFYFI